MNTIKLKNTNVLTNEDEGKQLRNLLLDSLEDHDTIVLDFEEIDNVSHTFLDESVGYVFKEELISPTNFKVVNTNTFVKKLLGFVFKKSNVKINTC